MKNIFNKLIWIVLAIPVIFLALSWKNIPETVALHFDLKGNPDRYGSKRELILASAILTAMNLFVYFLLTNIHRIDPRKKSEYNIERMRRIAFAVSVFMSALLCMIIYSSIKGSTPVATGLIFSGVGLLFAVIGNYMPNLKPNYFAGLRLPWALEDEDNWKRTHVVAGKLWFGGGILIAIVCAFLPAIPALIFFFTVMLIIVIIPAVVSYKIYKAKKG